MICRQLFIIACFVFLSPYVLAQDQDTRLITDYLERLENSRNYILLVAERMPEHSYSYKPTPESMSFAAHLMHIAWAMDWHCQSLLGGRPARDWNTDFELQVAQKSKEQMMATVNETFNHTIRFLKNFDVNDFDTRLDYLGLDRNKRQILLLLSDHITHHRAQMLVYLRLNNVTPPRYVLYQ
ncbi:MAG: damage-inducible protein DinB [Cytophagaceae bacterium]|nr:damage-inducible protein DinB [Cytophagaceae bacterium]